MNFIVSAEAEMAFGEGSVVPGVARENCFVLLHRNDNVLVCCRSVKLGEKIRAYGCLLTVDADVDVGHKLAFKTIKNGEKVKKYGVSIGSATGHIEPGAHIHLHNMKSDYIPSHTRDLEEQERG